jgi:hypothetical protein
MVSEYFAERNKVLSTNSSFLCWLFSNRREVSKMEVNEIQHNFNSVEQKDKVEAALVRLKALRSRVAEIRAECESLKEMQAKNQKETIVCSECGKGIEQSQEITIRDNSGNPRSYYHKDCFKAIWISQTWRFDYSSPGFLKRSESSR